MRTGSGGGWGDRSSAIPRISPCARPTWIEEMISRARRARTTWTVLRDDLDPRPDRRLERARNALKIGTRKHRARVEGDNPPGRRRASRTGCAGSAPARGESPVAPSPRRGEGGGEGFGSIDRPGPHPPRSARRPPPPRERRSRRRGARLHHAHLDRCSILHDPHVTAAETLRVGKGGARGVLLSCRPTSARAPASFRRQRRRHRDQQFRRRRPASSRRWRPTASMSRLGPGPGLAFIVKRLAGEGHCRHGGAAAAVRAGRAQ